MKSRKKAGLLIIAGTSLAGIVLLHGVGSAQQASGPPTLLYSGYLEEAGEPAEGTKQIGLSLWNARFASRARC